MEPSRGRARGRARGIRPATQETRPGSSAPPSQSPVSTGPPPLPGQWAGQRPGPVKTPSTQQQQHPVATPTLSYASCSAGPSSCVPPFTASAPKPRPSSSGVPASAEKSTGTGRGAMRGGRNIPEINTRPSQWLVSKKGTSGNPITLRANYFRLAAAPDWSLYQYHVDFAPEEDRTFVRKAMLGHHREILGGYMFDGTSLYLCRKLADNTTVLTSVRQSDGQHIQMTVKLTGTLKKGDPHYLQFYNILMRKCLSHLKLQLVGRNYFDAVAKVEIREHKFELWPGYITSIRQHESDLLMCAEITHKVMRQENLLEILNRLKEERRGGDFQAACKAEVIGITILTDYNNNTYRIDDIDFSTTPSSTFHLRREDREVTYADYYRNKYSITIRNLTQPMLVSRTSEKERRADSSEIVYLVPELCRATGMTDAMRTNFKLMEAMAEHTRISAQARVQKLNALNQRLYGEPKVVKEFRDWQLELDRQLVNIPARVLKETQIIFAGNCSVGSGPNADWTNQFKDLGLIYPAQLHDWVVIVPEKLMRDARNFVQKMQHATQNFQMSSPRFVEVRNDSAQAVSAELENIMSRTNPQLILCVIFKQRGDIYSAIKKKCCVDRPVPSQIVTAKCFNPKRMMSIATKVAIQMNCKIGGYPWSCAIPLKGLMVIGFDVCHDTNQRGKDFGAMVASLDTRLGRYFSAVSAHTGSEELSNDLSTNITKALHKYREINSALPEKIVIYRDGVGEGQIPYVFEHEVMNIRSKLGEFYQRPIDDVAMAYVIVNKKLNTRLFAENRGQCANPPAGTVVDDVITNPAKYDFFIVSQSIRQGSVAPTLFSVIHDNVGLEPDKMQMLTFRLMHMYFNWSGTVKVPAPVQFAHKLAFLVSQSIHYAPSPNLETLLYFL